MSRIKRILDEMMEDIFNKPLFELDSLFNKEQNENQQQFEEESFEVSKGKYKTNISCKFNEQGYPVGISYKSTYVPSEAESKQNQLQLQLDEAVEAEDFIKAADLKKQLDEVKEQKQLTN